MCVFTMTKPVLKWIFSGGPGNGNRLTVVTNGFQRVRSYVKTHTFFLEHDFYISEGKNRFGKIRVRQISRVPVRVASSSSSSSLKNSLMSAVRFGGTGFRRWFDKPQSPGHEGATRGYLKKKNSDLPFSRAHAAVVHNIFFNVWLNSIILIYRYIRYKSTLYIVKPDQYTGAIENEWEVGLNAFKNLIQHIVLIPVVLKKLHIPICRYLKRISVIGNILNIAYRFNYITTHYI